MDAKLGFASLKPAVAFTAALLAGLIAGTLLSATVFLFQSRGTPLEEAAAAERACSQYPYKSEQDACIREWISARRAATVAKR